MMYLKNLTIPKHKIIKVGIGKYIVRYRKYFWQKWKVYRVFNTMQDAIDDLHLEVASEVIITIHTR